MIIGNFTFDAATDTYSGDVTTLTFQRSNVRLTPNEKSSDAEPDFRVTSETPMGVVEFGAAWKRTSKGGQDFLSVSIDDPALSGALNAALFHGEQGDAAQLVWRRGNGKADAKPSPEAIAKPKPKASAKATAPAKAA